MQQWDLHSGEIQPYAYAADGDGVKAEFALPPSGSLLLFLAKQPGGTAAPVIGTSTTNVPAVGATEIRRLGPNVLTLDFVDVKVNGGAASEAKQNAYFYQATRFIFQKYGLSGNPWDRAVQFRDELITKTFPQDSGFEATYRFTIKDRVPPALHIVIERPDLYTITCNGQPVTATPGDWWLDRAFGRLDITSAARVGENAVTLQAAPLTMYHEVEPAYVLGEFALEPTAAGFAIVPDRPLALEHFRAHDNQIEGTMWLDAGIGYHRDPAAQDGNDGDPFLVFDLGRPCDLAGVEIWNYNEVNLTARGAKGIAMSGSATGTPDSFSVPLGTFELDVASGDSSGRSQRLPVTASGVRYIKFDFLSNQRGVTFPTQDGSQDNAFVGLSEVRFLARGAASAAWQEITGVKIRQASSALGGAHDRQAEHLLDGSGLRSAGLGWDRQGCPFYAEGVSYRQAFDVTQPAGRYSVSLPSWYGSVARVIVNGAPAGHITCPPWECDVTKFLAAGPQYGGSHRRRDAQEHPGTSPRRRPARGRLAPHVPAGPHHGPSARNPLRHDRLRAVRTVCYHSQEAVARSARAHRVGRGRL